jgi:hypothetical protein
MSSEGRSDTGTCRVPPDIEVAFFGESQDRRRRTASPCATRPVPNFADGLGSTGETFITHALR